MPQGVQWFSRFLREDSNFLDPITNNLDSRNPSWPYASVLAAWIAASGAARILLTAPTNFYYKPSTGSDSNPGTIGSPWASPAPLFQRYDFGGQIPTLNLQENTAQNVSFGGWVGGGEFIFDGGGHTISVVNNRAFEVKGGATPGPVTIQNVKLAATRTTDVNAGRLINVLAPATLFIGQNVEFGAADGHQVTALVGGAFVQFITDYTISGGGVDHLLAGNGGLIFYQNRAGTISSFNVTITGNPAFSTAFVLATSAGNVSCGIQRWNGSISGAAGQYNISKAGVLNTGNNGVSLPGNSANNVNSGGFLS